jgi:hypothetical protein
MNVFIYQAGLLCEACGEDTIHELQILGAEDTGDSDDYPQGPYSDGGGEADVPQHCDRGRDCINSEHFGMRHPVGAFLENPLTEDGIGYVSQQSASHASSGVVRHWAEHYGI